MMSLWKTVSGLAVVLAGMAAVGPRPGLARPACAAAVAADEEPGDDALRKLTVAGRAAASDQFSILTRALVVTGLIDTLRDDGPFTVFAPTDEAFARLGSKELVGLFRPENREKLTDVLKYHVLAGRKLAHDLAGDSRLKTVLGKPVTVVANGKGVAVNDATVVLADVPARNGVIHVIDRVLTPGQDDVLEVARKAGHFETLLAAAKAVGLDEALKGEGPYTIFAPTDEAFAKLGSKKLKALLEPENKQLLAEVLKYHVVLARVTARQAVTAGEAKTFQGAKVPATIVSGRLEIGGAKVSATDIEAGNGIIHVIDSVLVPPGR